MKIKKIKLFSFLFIALIASLFVYNIYKKIYKEGTIKDGYLYIKSSDKFSDLVKQITPFIKDTTDFKWIAKTKKFNQPKPGRYHINEGISNNELINLLRSGKQSPVNLTFNNQESLEELAKRIAEQIEADTLQLLNAFTKADFLKEKGFTKAQALG
ncbi:MAG TPA: aminodeoxychorismate lyase, partial [Flavobacteriia bacterium]|nr:aminodeoxychorismate lyase [Flavobacteriia bacterium]